MDTEQTGPAIGDIKRKTIKAFFSLTARQVVLRAMGFVTINIVLAGILHPSVLGIFNIAQALLTFFVYFSDIGLAASLIQKKEAITSSDIKTTFTIQQILVGALAVFIVIFAPQIATFYQLDSSGMWLIRALAVSFLLTSLKVIPSVLLERDLNFRPLVMVEIFENLIYNVLLIVLAYNGYGLWAFTYAVIARSIVGVILIYWYAPVPVRIGFEKQAAKGLLRFGVPFQLNSILALLKDRLVPLVIAKMITTTEMGFVTWSQGLTILSLEIMNVVIRITFPAFSRLQHDTRALAIAANRSLFVTTLFTYPALFGLGAILPTLVDKVINPIWTPAVPLFYLFAVSTYWAVISTTLTNLLNAMGYIKITLKLMVMWTVLTWLLTPILVSWYGFTGVAIGSFIISFTSALTIFYAKRLLDLKILDAILIPTVCSAIMGIIVFVLCQLFVDNWFSLLFVIGIGGVIYVAALFAIARKRIIADLKNLKS